MEIPGQWLTQFASEGSGRLYWVISFWKAGPKVAAFSEGEYGALVFLPFQLGKAMLDEDVLICLPSVSPLLWEAL